MPALLAVDVGIRTGLACYGDDGRLRWYRSHNFGTTERLRRGVHRLLNETPDLAWVVLEGGGRLAAVWEREAARQTIAVRTIDARVWRQRLFYEREHRLSGQAKQAADEMARRVIAWSGAARPTALRHDAAEAVLIGLWGVLEVGWLAAMPAAVRR